MTNTTAMHEPPLTLAQQPRRDDSIALPPDGLR
ncbi:hypothetical protein UC8_40980 [Roseimaritima ulvae]|uniref:Uncharacterized protein n=1 Tax=Roseimaritima ulvae TaxID=980254 RepID=A0A5B9QSM8_9BACT|nr:hypothetical protein UC8_40980 [Roseimaritima ulvae]